MSIYDFNKGLDDAYMGNAPKMKYRNNSDYNEGFSFGEDIEARRDYDRAMEKEYEEYMNKQQKEYYKNLEAKDNENN